jgi:PncC family amidohydrolase
MFCRLNKDTEETAMESDMEDTRDLLAQTVVEELRQRGWTITFAESCTAGLAAGRLVNYPGASSVLNMGFVTYSDDAKNRLLGVRTETLARYGAVSEQTAAEMALGAAERAEAEVAISITGLAGPGGGTEELPVGTIWIGIACQGCVDTAKLLLQGQRNENRQETVEIAFRLLLQRLQEPDTVVEQSEKKSDTEEEKRKNTDSKNGEWSNGSR